MVDNDRLGDPASVRSGSNATRSRPASRCSSSPSASSSGRRQSSTRTSAPRSWSSLRPPASAGVEQVESGGPAAQRHDEDPIIVKDAAGRVARRRAGRRPSRSRDGHGAGHLGGLVLVERAAPSTRDRTRLPTKVVLPALNCAASTTREPAGCQPSMRHRVSVRGRASRSRRVSNSGGSTDPRRSMASRCRASSTYAAGPARRRPAVRDGHAARTRRPFRRRHVPAGRDRPRIARRRRRAALLPVATCTAWQGCPARRGSKFRGSNDATLPDDSHRVVARDPHRAAPTGRREQRVMPVRVMDSDGVAPPRMIRRRG